MSSINKLVKAITRLVKTKRPGKAYRYRNGKNKNIKRKLNYPYRSDVQGMGPGGITLNCGARLSTDSGVPDGYYTIRDMLNNPECERYRQMYKAYRIKMVAITTYPNDLANNQPTYINMDWTGETDQTYLMDLDTTKIVYNDLKKPKTFYFKPPNMMINGYNYSQYTPTSQMHTLTNVARLAIQGPSNYVGRIQVRIQFRMPKIVTSTTTLKKIPFENKVKKLIKEVDKELKTEGTQTMKAETKEIGIQCDSVEEDIEEEEWKERIEEQNRLEEEEEKEKEIVKNLPKTKNEYVKLVERKVKEMEDRYAKEWERDGVKRWEEAEQMQSVCTWIGPIREIFNKYKTLDAFIAADHKSKLEFLKKVDGWKDDKESYNNLAEIKVNKTRENKLDRIINQIMEPAEHWGILNDESGFKKLEKLLEHTPIKTDLIFNETVKFFQANGQDIFKVLKGEVEDTLED